MPTESIVNSFVRSGLVAALVLSSRELSAQRVRGVVRDSSVSAPLAGVVVMVVDSAGKTSARAIADSAGRFNLPLGVAAARLRAVRIGYAPRDVALTASGADLRVEFAMLPVAVGLGAVRVSDRELCPGSSDRGLAFQLWEQARAGLLATVVARETNPATATAIIYHRTISIGDNVVRSQTIEQRTAVVSRPFLASAPPAEFAERGYMNEEQTGGGRTYFAPDADVLLDGSFIETHCIHLVGADAQHPNQTGLAFTPVSERDTLVDVIGTLWIDRAASAIRSLEFRYTGLEPDALRENVGGHLEFRTVKSGLAFVERWSLRLPVMTQFAVLGTGRNVAAPRRRDRKDFRVTEFREAGGEVVAVDWQTGVTWRDAPSRVTGSITERGVQRPASHVLVTLAGIRDTAATDIDGRFTLGRVIPGRYSITVIDTTFAAFASPRTESRVIEVLSGGRTTSVQLELPPTADLLSKACGGKRLPSNTSAIFGRVTTADGSPLRGALVTAFPDNPVFGTNREAIIAAAKAQGLATRWESTADVNGRFSFCGVATGRSLRFVLTKTKDGAEQFLGDTTIVPRDRTTSLEWRP